MAEETHYLARTPDFSGYWGRHKDGIHHAIASCCDIGASRFGIFVVYSGGPSMSCDSILGNLQWSPDEKEPSLEGVYTASGCYLAHNLAELADYVRKDPEYLADEYGIDRRIINTLKAFKNEESD